MNGENDFLVAPPSSQSTIWKTDNEKWKRTKRSLTQINSLIPTWIPRICYEKWKTMICKASALTAAGREQFQKNNLVGPDKITSADDSPNV